MSGASISTSSRARRIGRYLVLDPPAFDGGLGRTVGYDPELGRRVELLVVAASEPTARTEAIRQRAQLLGQLVHPSLVRVHDVGTQDRQLFVALDYLDGEGLQTWLERVRRWRPIVRMLAELAEGLEAAHREGLWHGAIGLDSVIVGSDARPRLTGFFRNESESADEGRALDQTAFTRLVFRALWGRDAPVDSSGSSSVGAPQDPRLPRLLRREVAQALEQENPPTIGSLAQRLRKAASSSRRWLWSGLASFGAAAWLLSQLAGPGEDDPANAYCAAFEQRLSQTWNDQRRDAVGSAVDALGIEFAQEAWARVSQRLDAFAAELASAQAIDCRARAGGSPDEPRSLCLHRKFEELRALTETLEGLDAPTIATLSDAARRLGAPSDCEAGATSAPTAPEQDLEAAIRIESALSSASMLLTVGRAEQSAVAARRALAIAEELDANYYICEAEYALANALWALDDESALESLHRSFAAGLAASHDERLADVATLLGAALGELSHYSEAENWFAHAEAALERQPNPRASTSLEIERGELALLRGDYPAALEMLASTVPRLGEDVPLRRRIRAVQLLAEAQFRGFKLEDAVATLQEIIATAEEQLGSKHPDLGAMLVTLARNLEALGRTDESRAAGERGLRLMEDAYGPYHRGTLSARSELLNTLIAAGDLEQAEAQADRLLADTRVGLGPENPRYPGLADSVARALFVCGRRSEAVGLFAEAVERGDALEGRDHPRSLIFLNNLAASLMLTGDLAEAESRYRDIVARKTRRLGPDAPPLVSSLLGLGATLTKQDRPADAIPLLERALEIGTKSSFANDRIAKVQFELAQAYWDADRDRGHALSLASSAMQQLVLAAEKGTDVETEIDDLRGWLDAVQSEAVGGSTTNQ